MKLRMIAAVLLMPMADCCGGGGGAVAQEDPSAVKALRDAHIRDAKNLRVEIENLKQKVASSPFKSAERTLCYRSLQQAKHWLGEELQTLGTDYPYPNSMNPANSKVDPPADMPPQAPPKPARNNEVA